MGFTIYLNRVGLPVWCLSIWIMPLFGCSLRELSLRYIPYCFAGVGDGAFYFWFEAFHWLWLGGVAYSVGGILEFLRWPNPFPGVIHAHEIFHIFVILGALCHWVFVYKWSAHPVRDLMTFHVTVFPENRYYARAVGDALTIESESLEELHVEIKRIVRRKYHRNISPKIHLKYFNEETLD